MCNFKSGIVLRDEREKGGFRLLMSPWTESHHEIETIYNLRDTGDKLAKVEFSPPSLDTAHQVETYKFTIDESRTPEWFTTEMQEAVKDKMTAYIKRIIVTGDVALLIGGQFIIAPGAKVECAKACVINALCGGTISEVSGGTISEVRGGTISAVWGGTISAVRGGTISEVLGGTISAVRGGTISEVRGGTISAVWGGTISAVRGGTISEVSKYFDGIIGKISKGAKIITDNRLKQH